MLLKDNELIQVQGGSLKVAIAVGVGAVISFLVGVFQGFFSKSC